MQILVIIIQFPFTLVEMKLSEKLKRVPKYFLTDYRNSANSSSTKMENKDIKYKSEQDNQQLGK